MRTSNETCARLISRSAAQDLIELRSHLSLVRLRLLQQSDQSLHIVLQLPLQFREARLRLQYFCAKVSLLRVAEADRVLPRHHQFRRKHQVIQGSARQWLLRAER